MARYDFPIVHIGTDYLNLNSAAAVLFPARHVSFRASADLLVLKPAARGAGAYSVFSNRHGGLVCRMPADLLRLKLKPGDYKLYRAGDAFAIRRNERLNEEAG